MGSTFFSLHYHIVFSTKERRPFIKNTWQPDLHSYLGGIINGMKGVAEIVGGVEDHVHLLVSLRPVHCIADVLRDLKKDSSAWAKKFDRRFSWQEGYAAFTVSPTATDAVRRYIANQEEHHRKFSFIDELKSLLPAAGIEYDEKYLL
jgi:REP element-mobilizing transposase RayT